MTNVDGDRPFIKVEVEDRHGIYIVRVGNWRLIKDLETGQGQWEWDGATTNNRTAEKTETPQSGKGADQKIREDPSQEPNIPRAAFVGALEM